MQCNGIINIQTYSGKQHWEPWELPISKSTEKNKKNPAYPTIASTVVAVSQKLLSPRCRPLHIFIKSTQCQCRKGPRRPPQAQLAIVWNLPGSFCGSQNTTPTPMVATPHFRIRIKWLNVYMYIIWDCNKPASRDEAEVMGVNDGWDEGRRANCSGIIIEAKQEVVKTS
jgi:hypothetical protein